MSENYIVHICIPAGSAIPAEIKKALKVLQRHELVEAFQKKKSHTGTQAVAGGFHENVAAAHEAMRDNFGNNDCGTEFQQLLAKVRSDSGEHKRNEVLNALYERHWSFIAGSFQTNPKHCMQLLNFLQSALEKSGSSDVYECISELFDEGLCKQTAAAALIVSSSLRSEADRERHIKCTQGLAVMQNYYMRKLDTAREIFLDHCVGMAVPCNKDGSFTFESVLGNETRGKRQLGSRSARQKR